METMLQQMQQMATQIDQISRCDIDPILFNDWANIWLKTWRKGLVSNITYEETYKDAGGRAAEQHIRELLDETQYEIVSLRQSVGKDWNEYLDKWRQIAEDAAQLPTTGTYSIQPGKSVGRVHYLNDRCEVVSTTDYDDRAAFQHEVRRCLSMGQRIVAETPEQQARIHRDRILCMPAQAKITLKTECEMEC